MVQAGLKGHSSSISDIVGRLEQRQVAEGGSGSGAGAGSGVDSDSIEMNSKLDIRNVTSFTLLHSRRCGQE
jgi:hypothetical protein